MILFTFAFTVLFLTITSLVNRQTTRGRFRVVSDNAWYAFDVLMSQGTSNNVLDVYFPRCIQTSILSRRLSAFEPECSATGGWYLVSSCFRSSLCLQQYAHFLYFVADLRTSDQRLGGHGQQQDTTPCHFEGERSIRNHFGAKKIDFQFFKKEEIVIFICPSLIGVECRDGCDEITRRFLQKKSQRFDFKFAGRSE